MLAKNRSLLSLECCWWHTSMTIACNEDGLVLRERRGGKKKSNSVDKPSSVGVSLPNCS